MWIGHNGLRKEHKLLVIKKNNLGNNNKNLEKSDKREIENIEKSEISDTDFLSNDAFKNEINKKKRRSWSDKREIENLERSEINDKDFSV